MPHPHIEQGSTVYRKQERRKKHFPFFLCPKATCFEFEVIIMLFAFTNKEAVL